MTDKNLISWVKHPVNCRHSPSGFHYVHIGFLETQVVHLSCECADIEGTAYCSVEYELEQENSTCYAALVDIRKLLKNSYSYASGSRRLGLNKAVLNIRNHLPEERKAKGIEEDHWFLSRLVHFNVEANKVRSDKIRPYTNYMPRSPVSRKAFLLEKYVRRHMGIVAPMFHVHPHKEDDKLVLRMGTTAILTCGLDLESQRRKHQSWKASAHEIFHSNTNSRDCLFCNRTYYNMGSHTLGQGHIKRVAEAVNRARKIMSPEGIKGASLHEQGISFHT